MPRGVGCQTFKHISRAVVASLKCPCAAAALLLCETVTRSMPDWQPIVSTYLARFPTITSADVDRTEHWASNASMFSATGSWRAKVVRGELFVKFIRAHSHWAERASVLRIVVLALDGLRREGISLPEIVPTSGLSQIHVSNIQVVPTSGDGVLGTKLENDGCESMLSPSLSKQLSFIIVEPL